MKVISKAWEVYPLCIRSKQGWHKNQRPPGLFVSTPSALLRATSGSLVYRTLYMSHPIVFPAFTKYTPTHISFSRFFTENYQGHWAGTSSTATKLSFHFPSSLRPFEEVMILRLPPQACSFYHRFKKHVL